jgi:hypothetical protein
MAGCWRHDATTAEEPVSEGRPSNRAAPDFEDLRQMRPLIIHLGRSARSCARTWISWIKSSPGRGIYIYMFTYLEKSKHMSHGKIWKLDSELFLSLVCWVFYIPPDVF